MAADSVKKKVYYRRAQFEPAVDRTLQQLIATALMKHPKIRSRTQTLDASANELLCVTHHTTDGGFVCGRLTSVERGRYQAVIDDDPDAETVALDMLAPPKKNGKQQEFVPGVLYFVCHKNHLAVCQSHALRASALERYIGWLLRSRANLIGPRQGLVLKDEPQKATKEKIRKAHVTSVMVGKPLMEELEIRGHDGHIAKQYRATGAALEAFKKFFTDDHFEKFGLEDEVFDGNLELWLEVRYPKRSRVRPIDSVKLLDSIGIAFRDMDEDGTELKLADGSTVYGAELRISGALQVEASKGAVSELLLYRLMREWVRDLVKNGAIAAD